MVKIKRSASLAALRISGQGQKTDLGLMLINPLSRIKKRFDWEVWAQKPGISPARNRRAIAKNEKSQIHPSSCLDLLE
jgi:hypothetical protein